MPEEQIVAPDGTPTEPVTGPVTEPVTEPVAEPNWLLSLPEEYQNSEILNQYKTIEDLAKGHIETKRMVGDRVKIPDENTTPEDVAKFYSRLGRPETPDGYEFTQVEMPPTLPIDENLLKGFKSKAHELGLTKKQADGVYVDYLNNIKEMNSKIIADYEAGVNQQLEVLKTRWGDQFEANKAAAINSFKQLASPSLQATVEKEGWGNHPDFVELFHKISVATSEDNLRPSGTPVFSSLDEKIKTLHKEVADMPHGATGRKEKLEQLERLYKERYPEGS
jgi:hypothetical protein